MPPESWVSELAQHISCGFGAFFLIYVGWRLAEQSLQQHHEREMKMLEKIPDAERSKE